METVVEDDGTAGSGIDGRRNDAIDPPDDPDVMLDDVSVAAANEVDAAPPTNVLEAAMASSRTFLLLATTRGY